MKDLPLTLTLTDVYKRFGRREVLNDDNIQLTSGE